MDAVRLDAGRWELDEVVGRAEAGETVEIMRGDKVVAKLVPAEPETMHAPERSATSEEWRTLLDELRRGRESMPYDPSNSVEEMRREARY